jgi:hypothetical protein
LNEHGEWKKRSELVNDQKRREFEKVVSIAIAISQSRKVEKIALALNGKLSVKCDDVFRAELLLGYMAGIPRSQKEDVDIKDQTTTEED